MNDAAFTTNREEISSICSSGTKPLALSVLPVSTKSTMQCAKPTTGASSIETQVLETLQIYGKNVGTPDLLYQGIILENDKDTVKANSSNNLGISDFSVGGKYATFNFSPTDVNTDEYIGFRAFNAGTNPNSNYMAISRDSSVSSPNLYAVYPNTTVASSFYGLTWIASGSASPTTTTTRLPPPPLIARF